jgi:hypothetical protein
LLRQQGDARRHQNRLVGRVAAAPLNEDQTTPVAESHRRQSLLREDVAAQQGDEADEAKHIGASQPSAAFGRNQRGPDGWMIATSAGGGDAQWLRGGASR